MKTSLVFLEVDTFNVLFVKMLSYFFQTYTFHFKSSRLKSIASRCELMNLDDYLTVDQFWITKTQAVQSWKKISTQMKNKNLFEYHFPDDRINFYDKAWKEHGAYWEKFFIMKNLNENFSRGKKFLIVKDLNYILSAQFYQGIPSETASATCQSALINTLNIMLNVLFSHFHRLLSLHAQTFNIIFFCFQKKSKPSLMDIDMDIDIVWSAVNHHELSSPLSNSKAFWPSLYTQIGFQKILYFSPSKMFTLTPTSLPSDSLKYVVNIFQLIPFFKNEDQWAILKFTLKNYFSSLCTLFFNKHRSEIAYRAQELFIWIMFAKRFHVKCYVSSVSESLLSNHQVLIFNHLKIPTVFFVYSANSFHVSLSQKTQLLHLSYSKILNTHCFVWHDKYRQVLQRDYNYQGSIHVIGPMMSEKEYRESETALTLCHDIESVITQDLNARGLKLDRPIKDYTIVSVYDVSPQIRNMHQGLLPFNPSIYNPQYCTDFLSDIHDLAQKNPQFIILIKPKRNNRSSAFPLPKVMSDILEWNEMNNPRWINLPFNTNPWLPILTAKINICIPFTSIAFAALGKNRSFLFHNPRGMIRFHEYHDLEDFISTDLQTLHDKCQRILNQSLQLSLETRKNYAPDLNDETILYSEKCARELISLCKANQSL